MAKKVLSIEIGLQETKVCELAIIAATRRVIRSVTFSTPQNTIEDGYIRDKATFCNALKSVLKKEKFTTNHAIFAVTSTKIYTKEIILPYVSTKKIKEILNTNLAEYLPFSIQDYSINYSLIEKIKKKTEKKIRILLIAMPENMVKNYYSLAEMAGLEVVALDYSGNSIYQILKEVPMKGTNVFIQMNEESTMVNILKDHTLVLQRTISYGTNELVQTVLEHNNEVVLSEEDAYALLQREDLIARSYAMIQKADLEAAITREIPVDLCQTCDAVMEAASYLVSSIGRVLDYYINQGGTAIQNIFLLGQGSKLQGMQEFIQKEIGIFPQTMEQFHGYRCGKRARQYQENAGTFISCLGCVLKPIGFLPKDLVAKKVKRSNIMETSLIITLCLGASLVLWITGDSDCKEKQKELDQANEILAGIPEGSATQSVFDETLRQLGEIENLNRASQTNVEQIYEIMEVLEQNMVTLTDVKSMQVTNEAITMSVTLPSKKAAAKLMIQLQGLSDYFANVVLSGVSESKQESGVSQVVFSISCVFHQSAENEGVN